MSNKRNQHGWANKRKRAARRRALAEKMAMSHARQHRHELPIDFFDEAVHTAPGESVVEAVEKKFETVPVLTDVVEDTIPTLTDEVELVSEESLEDEIDLTLRWHVLDAEHGDVISTHTSRDKARAAVADLKKAGADCFVHDSQKATV